MKSESNSIQRLACLAALLIIHQLFAAEERPTRSLPAPPVMTTSVAAHPVATDAGPANLANPVEVNR